MYDFLTEGWERNTWDSHEFSLLPSHIVAIVFNSGTCDLSFTTVDGDFFIFCLILFFIVIIPCNAALIIFILFYFIFKSSLLLLWSINSLSFYHNSASNFSRICSSTVVGNILLTRHFCFLMMIHCDTSPALKHLRCSAAAYNFHKDCGGFILTPSQTALHHSLTPPAKGEKIQ